VPVDVAGLIGVADLIGVASLIGNAAPVGRRSGRTSDVGRRRTGGCIRGDNDMRRRDERPGGVPGADDGDAIRQRQRQAQVVSRNVSGIGEGQRNDDRLANRDDRRIDGEGQGERRKRWIDGRRPGRAPGQRHERVMDGGGLNGTTGAA
jgi:hypothetical protein